ncbi:hypothetical protein ACHQM5_016357 [Ranunculus cassubicifolius]
MATPLMFTNLSCKLFRGKAQEPNTLSTNSINSSIDLSLALKEIETISISNVNIRSKPRRTSTPKRKWSSRKERRGVDMVEYDVVLVPSDGGYCLSGSESDGSDWSTGWVEPHGPEFQKDDDGFAVLVPCYGNIGRKKVGNGSNGQLSGAEFTNVYTTALPIYRHANNRLVVES